MDKQPLENWQKYMENGEYLRSSEIGEEQNYNMIDGRRNNMSPKGKEKGICHGKVVPQTGGDCKAVWEACAADGGGRRYGAQTEVRKGEVSGERCRMLLSFYVLNNGAFLCIIKP